MTRLATRLCAWLLLALLSACGGRGPAREAARPQEVPFQGPAWVRRGAGVFQTAEGATVIEAVGMVASTAPYAAVRPLADARARAEALRLVTLGLDKLAASYQAGGKPARSPGPLVSALKGELILDHWRGEEDRAVHSLCRLELPALRRMLENAEGLEPGLREHLLARLEEGFRPSATLPPLTRPP